MFFSVQWQHPVSSNLPTLEPTTILTSREPREVAEHEDLPIPAEAYRDTRSYSTNDVETYYTDARSTASSRCETLSRKRSYSMAGLGNASTQSSPDRRVNSLRIDVSRQQQSDGATTDPVAAFQALRGSLGTERALVETLASTLHEGHSSTGMSPHLRHLTLSASSTPGRRNRSRLQSVLSPLDSDSEEDDVPIMAQQHPEIHTSHNDAFTVPPRPLEHVWITPTNGHMITAHVDNNPFVQFMLHGMQEKAFAPPPRPITTSFALLAGGPHIAVPQPPKHDLHSLEALHDVHHVSTMPTCKNDAVPVLEDAAYNIPEQPAFDPDAFFN